MIAYIHFLLATPESNRFKRKNTSWIFPNSKVSIVSPIERNDVFTNKIPSTYPLPSIKPFNVLVGSNYDISIHYPRIYPDYTEQSEPLDLTLKKFKVSNDIISNESFTVTAKNSKEDDKSAIVKRTDNNTTTQTNTLKKKINQVIKTPKKRPNANERLMKSNIKHSSLTPKHNENNSVFITYDENLKYHTIDISFSKLKFVSDLFRRYEDPMVNEGFQRKKNVSKKFHNPLLRNFESIEKICEARLKEKKI